MRTLIKGGEIVTAVDRYRADVLVEDAVVTAIGRDLAAGKVDRTLDAKGKLVFPGGIDPHTHMELPFMGTVSSDDFFTGTRAALVGGTTTIIDFAIPAKGQSLSSALAAWDEKARGKACCDYAYHMAVTDWNDQIQAEIAEMVQRGITSFKTFMAYKGVLGIDDGQLFSIIRRVREVNGLVTVHAVNGDVLAKLSQEFLASGRSGPEYHYQTQPRQMEGEATHRAIALADLASQGIYIVHVTCRDSLEEIKRARYQGKKVWAETCTQYLLLTQDLYHKNGFEGAKYVLSPPLREREDTEALWGALARGDVQTTATDHCPFNFIGQKDMGKGNFTHIPNGLPGVEDRMALLYSYGVQRGRINIHQYVALTSTHAAKLFGLFPRKGTVAVGSDADLVIFDPSARWTVRASEQTQRVDHNVYEGFEVQGRVQTVLSAGRVVVEDGRFVGQRGKGRFLERAPFDPAALA